MFFSAGATFVGRPVAVSAISSSKPGDFVAVTVAVIGPPRSTSAASNFAASVKGGFSVTANPTSVYSVRGGYARPAIAWRRTVRPLAYSVTTWPLIVALPTTRITCGPIGTSGEAVMRSVVVALGGGGAGGGGATGAFAGMVAVPVTPGGPTTLSSTGPV